MTTKEKEESQAQPLRKDEQEEVEEEFEDIIEKWISLVDAIRDTTRAEFAASPPAKDTPAADFQRYWREVFEKLSASVSSDPAFPEYLTSPPCRKFEIVLFSEPNTTCCPCSHVEVSPTVLIRNETGVTKHDFLRGFIDYMYDEKLPGIYFEDENATSVVQHSVPALVYYVNWMSAGRNANGERKALVNEEDPVPTVFMYCAEPGEFEAKHLEHNTKK